MLLVPEAQRRNDKLHEPNPRGPGWFVVAFLQLLDRRTRTHQFQYGLVHVLIVDLQVLKQIRQRSRHVFHNPADPRASP